MHDRFAYKHWLECWSTLSQAQAREALHEYVKRNLTERARRGCKRLGCELVLDDLGAEAEGQLDEPQTHVMVQSTMFLKYKFLGIDICYRAFLRLTGERFRFACHHNLGYCPSPIPPPPMDNLTAGRRTTQATPPTQAAIPSAVGSGIVILLRLSKVSNIERKRSPGVHPKAIVDTIKRVKLGEQNYHRKKRQCTRRVQDAMFGALMSLVRFCRERMPLARQNMDHILLPMSHKVQLYEMLCVWYSTKK